VPGYIDIPLETDPDRLALDAIAYLMDKIPNWEPHDASLEVWLIQVLSRIAAETRDVASAVPVSIFRWYGRNLIGLQPTDSASARVTTTWEMVDAQGYTITAGTVAAFRTAGDELVAFEVAETFTVSPGQTTTAAGSVVLTAVDEGAATNGLTGTLEIVDALAFVKRITATAPSTGGVDAESDDTYLGRLHEELQLLTPRPILPRDFAVLARRTAGVYRAMAIGEYNPADNTFNNERMVTVVGVTREGTALPTATKAAVRDYLDAMREVNFVVNVSDPTYTTVNVGAGVRTLPGFITADVLAAVRAEITRVLDPGVWGGGDASPPEWRVSANRVRYTEIAALIDNVPGVDYVETPSLLLNGASADVILAGAAPLPQLGSLNVTAV
jgi:hypothetical protein